VLGKSVLFPKKLWESAGGVRNYSDASVWEFGLRLDQVGAIFRHLPFNLYARRRGNATENLSTIPALEMYSKRKNLNWIFREGPITGSVRAIPSLLEMPSVQVIIPFKEQKELTLCTVNSLLRQREVNICITAVDNGSRDLTIGEAIKALGGEVMRVEEPFNFSRLNNLGVRNTAVAGVCPYLLFLNNDVELEERALLEMCRWIEQPSIGMVGCRLVYPNGLLQHGGIDLKSDAPAHQMLWNHSEKMTASPKQRAAQIIRLADAVTAACALMKREIFTSIGGFDEVWYPVAYSDTSLAVKVEAMGLHILYTPFAQGVHHESVSREYENIEDVEMSSWLHQHFVRHHEELKT
jgi:GT2 family glycosyltransferase